MKKTTQSTDNLHAQTNAQVSYADNGRSGTIYYTSSETRFDLWYELALEPAIAIIGIPKPQYWEAQTKTPLSQRTAILNFIGHQVVNDKVGGEGSFGIEQDNIMTIYRAKK
ncbi:hypothetical protein GCM10028818_39820 [Spirosoma horti]